MIISPPSTEKGVTLWEARPATKYFALQKAPVASKETGLQRRRAGAPGEVQYLPLALDKNLLLPMRFLSAIHNSYARGVSDFTLCQFENLEGSDCWR